MEGSGKPGPVPPGPGRTSAMFGPRLSDPPEKLHSETDSFLTAARLLRRGWTEEEGKKTTWRFSRSDHASRQTVPSGSDGNQGPKRVEMCLKDPRSRRVPDVNAGDRETHSEKKADEAKQTSEGAYSADRKRERQTGLRSQAGTVYVWASGCRNTCKQSRRFKAPILPVIAEI